MDVASVSGDRYSKGGTGTIQKVHKIKLYIGSNCCVEHVFNMSLLVKAG